MTNSSASSATITSIAVFENGRPAEGHGTTNLIFDAQIYLGDDCPPLLAALRYFNSENHVFNEIGFYFIVATVAKMESGAHIALQNNTGIDETDYDVVGNVVMLIPITGDAAVNPTIRPYIHVCGTVRSVDDLAGTFTIDAHQYVNALKTATNSNFNSMLPVECSIPNTPRWHKNGKKFGIPHPNRYISVTGFLTGRKTRKEHEVCITECFTLEIQSIVFLGRPVVANSSGSPIQARTPGAKSKMKFDFSSARANKCLRLDDNATESSGTSAINSVDN
ncbi:hypothetical protein DEU56DRAFT_755884 [Suillus clintonianus]|uniref:uncharacterized protein n=1 Tax=Suillus clintonianus TaxID=1904413 RepID=UPI001B87F668|nr:uncharacterized protein DEU56DRAFT_755884 [Suillus clintonianus]KAG2138314.1 hypothetical protein DEU56DRAFT_755884 [Suillus clintonianus]